MRDNNLKSKLVAVGTAAIISACTFLPSITVHADAIQYDVSNGYITIDVSSTGQTFTIGNNSPVDDETPVISGATTRYPITINTSPDREANVILSDVYLYFTGNTPAIVVYGTGTVNFEIDGWCYIKSGETRACIEASHGASIVIKDDNGVAGELVLNAGRYAAAIGSGQYGDCGDITIKGGTIDAVGGQNGAAIGAGSNGSYRSITIIGGTVSATSGRQAAGIGGGYLGSGDAITISGGDINAIAYGGGAAIGGGKNGGCNGISITGGNVRASADSGAAGIGAGSNSDDGTDLTASNISISGSAVVSVAAEIAIGAGGNGIAVGDVVSNPQSFTGAVFYYSYDATISSMADGSATCVSSYVSETYLSEHPVEPDEPANTENPTDPATSTDPENPTDSTTPADPAEQPGSSDPENPSDVVTPGESEPSNDPEAPSEPEADQPPVDTTMSDLCNEISSAIARGGEQTIYWERGTSLSYNVMKLLEDNPDITIVFSYTYLDVDYTVTICGKDVKANPNIPWYGPAYLYTYYGVNAVTEIDPIAPSGIYTVVPGDTLSAIAERLSTTVDYLVLVNDIKDPNKINVGQVIAF